LSPKLADDNPELSSRLTEIPVRQRENNPAGEAPAPLLRKEGSSENEIRDPQSAIRIRVVCSAGTYIRTLAEDIGRRVGVGAHVRELRRTRAGRFGLNESVTLEAIEKAAVPKTLLMQIEEAVINLPEFTLQADRVEKTLNGLSTRTNSDGFCDGAHVRMVDENKNLVAIGVFQEQESQVKPIIVLA